MWYSNNSNDDLGHFCGLCSVSSPAVNICVVCDPGQFCYQHRDSSFFLVTPWWWMFELPANSSVTAYYTIESAKWHSASGLWSLALPGPGWLSAATHQIVWAEVCREGEEGLRANCAVF
jgi:hypothetical protein